MASIIVVGALVISLGLGKYLHNSEIRAARQYVAGIVPKLEEYKKEHGSYPESLSVFPDSRPPRLLREFPGYRAIADRFYFEYWDSAGMMDGYCFDSSSREWHYTD